MSHAAFVAVTVRGDYAAGNQALRRILALSEARGYEPATSQARFLLALLGCWFGPIEDGLQAAQRAREGLIAGGDLANAAYTYNPTVYYLLDWAPSLDTFAAEVQAGLAFVRRTGNDQAGQWLDCYRWLAAVLRGESSAEADDAIPPTAMPAIRWRFSTRTSPERSPPPSSAIWTAWRGTPRRRCRCCRSSGASTRPPWPACCAGWPWPGRPAPATVASGAAC